MVAEVMRIVSPQVMAIAARLTDDSDPNVVWSVGYAPETDHDERGRVLLAHLHAASGDGCVDIDIAATQLGGRWGDLGDEQEVGDFEHALEHSEALELLYDFACLTARALIGTIGARIDLPARSLDVQLTPLVRMSLDGQS